MANDILDEPPVTHVDPGTFEGIVSRFEQGMKEVREAGKTEPKVDDKKGETKIDPKTDPQPRTDDGKWTSPKAADWKKLKGERDEAQTKATTMEAELKAKLAEIESLKKEPKVDPKELETLKGERDALLGQIETVALERSERFQNHYKKIFDDSIKMAKESVEPETAELVEHLLQLPPSKHRKEQLETIMGAMTSEVDKLNLSQAVRDMDRARIERDDVLKNSKTNLAKLREKEAQERTEAELKNRSLAEQAINEVLRVADTFDAFKPIEGDEEHNKEIPKRKQFIKDFFERKLAKEDYALIPVLAKRAEHLEKVNAKLVEELKKAQAALAGNANANPDLTGGGKPTADGKQKGFMEVFMDNLPMKSK